MNLNTAFIGLDYILDIMHPDGKIATSAKQAAERKVIDKANQVLRIAKEKKWLSILVKVGFSPGYPDHPAQSAMFGRVKELGALEEGKRGMDFHPDLQVDLADMTIIKPRVSVFYSTVLEAALRATRIDRIVFSGVSTTWAVQSAARDAHDRDYQVIVVEDACAAATLEEHQHSITALSRIAKIITVNELSAL
jgi:nicotinamidase-related amidase